MKRLPILLFAAVLSAVAYVPLPIDGPTTHRADFAHIQFLVNQSIAAGLTNNAGNVWITADSSPSAAISGAIGAWNGVATTAAHFLPVQSTSLSYNQTDGNNVIVFADDPYTESVTNGILAFTPVVFYTDGTIFDTDIYFSPYVTFSTTLAAGTYDLQSVLTHEMGHSLGANHTNILSATMFQSNTSQDAHAQALSADEMAFVSALYLVGSNGYGAISGMATAGGSPLLGGLITAVDPNTGITVGGFSSVTTGAFNVPVPAGNYYIYAEPGGGLLLYSSLTPPTVLPTSFESAFAGGNSNPTYLPVQAGVTVTANIDAAPGITPIRAPLGATGIAGATGDFHGILTTNWISISSGQSVDYLFQAPFAATPTESNIQILGPAKVRTGSLRRDSIIVTSDGSAVYRVTLDIPPLTANTSASLVIRNGTDIVTRSGLFDLTRPQSVNAGSFLGGAVAAGEILSFFGPQLGPPNPASNGGFGSDGTLGTSLAGITVTFDQVPAPLFYASNNQINLQVPYEISSKSATLMTISYNGAVVASSTLTVAKSAPGIFVVTNADGSVNGPTAPSHAGDVLVIYGTGAGVTSGLLRTGAPAPANSTIAATVTLGGTPLTPIYAGMTPGSVGLTQVNVAIPAGTPPGTAIPLQYSMNGAPTQTVNIAVQ